MRDDVFDRLEFFDDTFADLLERKRTSDHCQRATMIAGQRRYGPDFGTDLPEARAAIIAEAKWLEQSGDADALVEAADKTPEPFSTSKTSNWVARAGGLPNYIQHIAHDLVEKRGKSESQAIQMAIGIVKRWCRGGGNVKPDTRAAACKAVAKWEAMKTKAKAT
jgi:hypothetical protein